MLPGNFNTAFIYIHFNYTCITYLPSTYLPSTCLPFPDQFVCIIIFLCTFMAFIGIVFVKGSGTAGKQLT
jgi:predicted membrane channel-forming protein YqfA (hemolysin III family)